MRTVAAFFVVLTIALRAAAQTDVIAYPAAPHFNPDEGTVECWIRLEQEPTPEKHYFPVWSLNRAGQHRIALTYQTIWRPEHFHFFFSSTGMMLGKIVPNAYFATAEDTQKVLKGETAANPVPRTPRLKKGEWHHLAVTWQGLPQSTVTIYFDGRRMTRTQLQAPLWEELEALTFTIRGYVYETITIDELRISCVERSDEEIQASFAAGEHRADRHTLLLDRFDDLQANGEQMFTKPEVFTAGLDRPGGLVIQPQFVELVEGRCGKGLKMRYR